MHCEVGPVKGVRGRWGDSVPSTGGQGHGVNTRRRVGSSAGLKPRKMGEKEGTTGAPPRGGSHTPTLLWSSVGSPG